MKHLLLTTIAAVLLVGCKSLQSPRLSDLARIEPRLVQPLKFEGLTVSNLDEVRDINNLFPEKISMGGQDGFVFLRLDLDDDESYVLTETTAQYLARRKRRVGPYTTYDLSMDSWFVSTAPTLVFLRASMPSKFSLLSDDLMDLSVSILPWVGSEERTSLEADVEKGMSLRDYSKQDKITKVRKDPYGISFETNHHP